MSKKWTSADLKRLKSPQVAEVIKATAKSKTPSSMNKLEKAWARMLQNYMLGECINYWAFEPLKLRLAKGAFYTPDFMVIENDGSISFHETKGFWRDDARVKIKVAATLFPWFEFKGIQRIKNEWKIEIIKPHL